MNTTNRTIPAAAAALALAGRLADVLKAPWTKAIAAAPVLALAAAAPAFAQSGAAPEDPAETFAGYELAGYGDDKHFCWVFDESAPQAKAEKAAAAAGGARTPVYTFELRTKQPWDMCLWPADANWEAGEAGQAGQAGFNYHNCDFARQYHDSAWNGVIYGEADGAEYIYPKKSYAGPQDEMIVYAGSIAGKMVCVDSNSFLEPAKADLLLFEGDTRSGEAGGADAGAETG